MKAVLVAADSQLQRVRRLVEFCRALDGTELTVLEGDDSTRASYPACNTNAFHQAAATLKDQPFLWIEPDSIPLKAGWLTAIEAEYHRVGKPILAPLDNESPFDRASGICVYPPESFWLFPKQYKTGAWDLWMQHHLAPLMDRTPLIQHSYGQYDENGDAAPHRFPRDAKILDERAVLFHRDRWQDLIPRKAGVRLAHYGDIGDVLAALTILRALGSGTLVVSESKGQNPGPRESLRGRRFDALMPLLEAQPYISGVEWQDDPEEITHDLAQFRSSPRVPNENLAQWQARHVDVDVTLDPWLTVPGVTPNGRVIVARSPRYHNRFFPWAALAHKYKSELLFVGLPEEHEAFRKLVGMPVPYRKTKDLLELAQLIAGAKLCIMNQSAPFWIAAGLGVPVVQESWDYDLNSIVARPNAIYTRNGPETRTLLYRL